jgi:hypothetical protein
MSLLFFADDRDMGIPDNQTMNHKFETQVSYTKTILETFL